MEELKLELNKRDQEILAVGAKMKTLEEQHQDYQRHISVLKESLVAKEEHYNMLQADVSILFDVNKLRLCMKSFLNYFKNHKVLEFAKFTYYYTPTHHTPTHLHTFTHKPDTKSNH